MRPNGKRISIRIPITTLIIAFDLFSFFLLSFLIGKNLLCLFLHNIVKLRSGFARHRVFKRDTPFRMTDETNEIRKLNSFVEYVCKSEEIENDRWRRTFIK